jgi:hypothetical protein
MKSHLVDIAGVKHAETASAILFSDTADRADAKWLPKSQIEFHHDGGDDRFVTVVMPEWLAIEKEFV